MTVLDFRHMQAPAGPPPAKGADGKLKPCGKVIGGKLVEREAKSISGITLHQTATLLPPGRDDVRNAARSLPAGMDKMVHARHLRALRVHAHVTAFTTGHAVVAYPLRAYVYHGNSLNAEDIGLECEAHLDGLDPTCDEKVVEAGRAALTWLVENAPREGIELRFIHAHRQSSDTRRGDPGLALWKAVALDHGVAKLGLKAEPHRTWGDGAPIPVQWDPVGGLGAY